MSFQRRVKVPIRNAEDFLRLMNGLFGLTDTEIMVLARFIYYLKIKSVDPEDLFSTELKNRVSTDLSISDINGYIFKLRSKRAISKIDNRYRIHPVLIPGKFKEIVFDLNFVS